MNYNGSYLPVAILLTFMRRPEGVVGRHNVKDANGFIERRDLVKLWGAYAKEVGNGQATSLRLRAWLAASLCVALAGTWFMSVSKAGTRVTGCPEACATVGKRRNGPLRVMSLNMLHGYPTFAHMIRRLDLIVEEIRRQDADIVCLQEVPWTWKLGSGAQYLSERTGLNYFYLRANGNRWAILFEEGVVILSRYPLTEPRFIELEPQAGFFEHRVVLHAIVQIPWRSVRVFVTHLTPSAPGINRQQVEALRSFVERTGSGPAIIAGDFNAAEHSPQIKALSRKWIDVFRASNPDDAGLTCCIADLTQQPTIPLRSRVDYVFLNADAAPTAQVLLARRVLAQPFQASQSRLWASDHIGLFTMIQLGPL